MNLSNNTLVQEGANFVLNPLLSRLVLAVFILLLGFILGRVFGLLVRRLLSDIQADKHLRSIGVKTSLERLLGGSVSIIIYIVTIILSLNTLGLTSTIVTIIILGLVFVVVVSFLLAVKDFFPNLFSGIKLRLDDSFHVGDEIQIREVQGRITALGLLETRIMTKHKEEIIIPNALFTKRKIIVKKRSR